MRMTWYNRRTTMNRIRERDEQLKMIRVFLALLLNRRKMFLALRLLQMMNNRETRAQTGILLTCPHQGHPPVTISNPFSFSTTKSTFPHSLPHTLLPFFPLMISFLIINTNHMTRHPDSTSI